MSGRISFSSGRLYISTLLLNIFFVSFGTISFSFSKSSLSPLVATSKPNLSSVYLCQSLQKYLRVPPEIFYIFQKLCYIVLVKGICYRTLAFLVPYLFVAFCIVVAWFLMVLTTLNFDFFDPVPYLMAIPRVFRKLSRVF